MKEKSLGFRLRKKLTRLLTQVYSGSGIWSDSSPINTNHPKVLIIRPNHRLGNQLMLSPLINELEQQFQNVEIHLFVKGGLCPILYAEHKSVTEYIALPKKHFNELKLYFSSWFRLRKTRYDLVINTTPSSSSGKLATRIAKASHKIYTPTPEMQVNLPKHMALIPVAMLRQALKIWGVHSVSTEYPSMEIRLTEDELQKGKVVLSELSTTPEKTIAIYTYATGAKCKDATWWKPFYEKLKLTFTEYSILEILPVENVSQIDFAAANYYSKDLREIAALTAHTALWIGTDSGMMHLAACTPTKVIGLFSVTNPEIYGPYRKGSGSVNIDKISQDELIKLVQEKLYSN